MLAFLSRTLPALVLAFAFASSGEFAQQYLQRLGGAVDALRAVVERFDASAAASGLTRPEAVERLAANEDGFVARQGADASRTFAEFEAVTRRYAAMRGAPEVIRPFVMLADPDWAMMRRVAEDFAPALPVGNAGLLLTLCGFLLGWGLGAGCHGAARLARRRRRRIKAKGRGDAPSPSQAPEGGSAPTPALSAPASESARPPVL